jgi:hypothetical protein
VEASLVRLALLGAPLLQACVALPEAKPLSPADEECKIVSREWKLDVRTYSLPLSTGDARADVVLIAGAGVVAAGSTVISGSVVVVGNTINWLERQGRCPGGLGSKLF